MGKTMKNIILDVDGTLWDTRQLVADAWNRALKEKGIEDIEISADRLKSLFGKTMDVIAEALFGFMNEKERNEMMDLCCEYEHEDLKKASRDILYPNVRETIIELSKDHGVYIVSNCQCGYIESFIKAIELEEYITDIECYGNTGKQKGENIKLIVERNHMEEPVYVGDIQGDCDAAAYAGVPFVYADYGFGDVENYQYRISNFKDLLTLK